MDILSESFLETNNSIGFSSSTPIKTDSTFLLDEDSGLGMEMDQKSPEVPKQTLEDGRKTGSRKRPAEDLKQTIEPKQLKRHRSFDHGRNGLFEKFMYVATSEDTNDAENFLTYDSSSSNSLPTMQGKHSDLSTISADTMQKVLSGDYDGSFDHVTVIDCRYPYEYKAGHIVNAINLYTKEGIDNFLTENTPTSSKHVLIFHCEFSSKRGPKLCRFLRSQDREMNRDTYPKLHFPEIYLLEGGYKQFYETHKAFCFPQAYKPMLDKQHSAELRHFRVKSKSWAAGDKPRYKTGLQRLKLSFN